MYRPMAGFVSEYYNLKKSAAKERNEESGEGGIKQSWVMNESEEFQPSRKRLYLLDFSRIERAGRCNLG